MSIIEPKIDELLNQTDNDRFLLCTISSKRAHDINEMMCNQRNRALKISDKVTALSTFAADIARKNNVKSLTIAFNEICNEDVSCDPDSIDIKNH